jgi:hypothetical protein
MTRLTIENLEGRDLLATGLGTVLGFTPPIGSNKGSLLGEMPGHVASEFIALQEATQMESRRLLLPYVEQEN